MTQIAAPEQIPIADAAMQLRMSRERVVRLIQTGGIDGARINGRWYVDRTALAAREAQQGDPLVEAAERVRRARTRVRIVQPIGDRRASR